MTELLTEPTLADLLADVMRATREDIHVALPGVVLSYDAATQTADVQPQIKRHLRKRDGSITTEDLPVLPGIPVKPIRAGGFYIHVPVTQGDHVLVLFCERDLNEWRRKGSNVDPGDTRTHTLAGAVAIPGLEDATNPITGITGSGIELGQIGGLGIKITSTRMEVGGNSDAAALASKVDALISAYNAHTHATAPTGPISPPSATIGGTSASTKLKIGG